MSSRFRLSPFLDANVGGLLTLRVVRGFIYHYKAAWWEFCPAWKQFISSFCCCNRHSLSFILKSVMLHEQTFIENRHTEFTHS
jgi:hypothetical protein